MPNVYTGSSHPIQDLLSIPGSRLLFGGRALNVAEIPTQYGLFEPTAVLLDLDSILSNVNHFHVATRELFGPIQV